MVRLARVSACDEATFLCASAWMCYTVSLSVCLLVAQLAHQQGIITLAGLASVRQSVPSAHTQRDSQGEARDTASVDFRGVLRGRTHICSRRRLQSHAIQVTLPRAASGNTWRHNRQHDMRWHRVISGLRPPAGVSRLWLFNV